jgi:lipid-A-disaccharide synthase
VTSLLVVAGEASGDCAAAAVVGRLHRVSTFGLGGAALEARGTELVGDLRTATALGVGEVAARAWWIGRAYTAVLRAARRRRPDAALLVNYTEFNAHLAPRLRASGVRVLWYAAPQIWAWRPGRARWVRRWVDRLAVVLPFEQRLWREHGVDAHYVGHPALEAVGLDRGQARRELGVPPDATAIAILPGSRPQEVRRLLIPMLDAYERVRRARGAIEARVFVAPSLDASARAWLVAACGARRVATVDVDPQVGATGTLRAFDASLCASGTACLEATLARAVPVVAYRVGLVTEIVARALLRTPHVALSNVLLGRRAFAELLQGEARAELLASALGDALDRRPALVGACDEVEAVLDAKRTPSVAVARLLAPWLDAAIRV